MNEQEQILNRVRAATQKKVLFLPHALRQMLRPDRMINRLEIRQVIAQGEIIENYPNDPRGHSCLMLGFGDSGRALHICCAQRKISWQLSQRMFLMNMSGRKISR
jgi:hypothetical protein